MDAPAAAPGTLSACVSVVRASAAPVLSLCTLTCSSHLLFPPFFIQQHFLALISSTSTPAPPSPPTHAHLPSSIMSPRCRSLRCPALSVAVSAFTAGRAHTTREYTRTNPHTRPRRSCYTKCVRSRVNLTRAAREKV